MDDELDKILCGSRGGGGGDGGAKAGSEQYAPLIKHEPVPPPATATTTTPSPKPEPLTVMGLHNTPVIVEDPVRFRKDIQTMVMAQMLNGLPDEDQFNKIKNEGSMIEIATVKHLVQAAEGNLDSFKYMMDRVLGKPVNQTNTVSMSVSYEQMLDDLNPDEVIEPKHVFCEEMQ